MENIVKLSRKELLNISIKKKFCISILLFLLNIVFFKNQICLANDSNNLLNQSESHISNPQNTISELSENWNILEDDELNDAIANSTEEELSNFLQDLDEKETQEILEKDTMLNNTINEYEAENTEDEISNQILVNSESYYEYLLDSASATATKSSSSTKFSTKSGHFFIQISGNGKTTKRKISVTLSTTDRYEQQNIKFSEVAVSGYSDNHNFTILTASSKAQMTDDCYTIFTMDFSYTKPAHYYAKGSYSNKVEGYRFNFQKYNYDNLGESTVNNTGHNASNITEKISLQINAANCGINRVDDKYEASNATGYINLSKKYYSSLQINPNGGTHNGKSSTCTYGTNVCVTEVNIGSPTRYGYKFAGWTLSKGSNCTGASFNSYTNKFTYCGKSTTTTNISSNNTCVLKANWEIIYGTVTVKPVDTQNNSLKDVKYSIYDSSGKFLQTLQVGDSGSIQFTKLSVGKYRVYEEKVKEGYELTKTPWVQVEITETNPNILLTITHQSKMVLPEAGGISMDLVFILTGIILIIIINKKRRNL